MGANLTKCSQLRLPTPHCKKTKNKTKGLESQIQCDLKYIYIYENDYFFSFKVQVYNLNPTSIGINQTESCWEWSWRKRAGGRNGRLTLADERMLTVDTPSLVAVVWTVVNFVALFGAVDAGPITTLELIRPTCQQGWGVGHKPRTHAH